MDVGAAVVAAREAAVVVQPGEGALYDPALRPEPGPVLGVALGDLRGDPARPEFGAVAAAVVGTVGEQHLGAELAVRADGSDAINQLEQLRDVVAVGAVTVSASGIPFRSR